ncbi:hypothetical protein ACROYT_G028074 [Oculina patagonica]
MAISDSLKRFHDPVWTAKEVEQFWSVLEPYLTQLLNHETALPESSIDIASLDPGNLTHKQHCMQAIHDSMWKGKYSLAVANIKAVRTFFRDTVQRQSSVTEQLQELKEVFHRRPFTSK